VILYADALLNLAWAAVCLAAFAWFVSFERRRAAGTKRALRYRAVALSLALVSLFPCVSASDDSVRLQFFGFGTATPNAPGHRPAPSSQPSDKKTLGSLVRLLEALESVQIAVLLVLSVVLCSFALALVERRQSLDRFLPTRAGRAPPAIA
jgi:hypothetical protein